MSNILSIGELRRAQLNKIKYMFEQSSDIVIQERGKDTCVLVDLSHYECNQLKATQYSSSFKLT